MSDVPTRPNTPNVHPLVRVGAAAHFQTYDRKWHRTEGYPSKCICGLGPMTQAVIVKPSIDDSWRYVPDDYWAPCLSILVRREEGSTDREPDLVIGDRIQFKNAKIAIIYDDDGTSGEFYVESFGRTDDMLRIVQLRDIKKNIYVRAPLAWVEQWQSPTKESDMTMADLTTKADPVTAVIKFVPTDDDQITCVICMKDDCTHEFSSLLFGTRRSQGIHETCLRGIRGVEIR